MNIIIAGAGEVGTHLARLLSNENLSVVLIDESEEKLSKLNNDLDIMTLNVLPTSINGLRNAGISKADLFIAVTPNESENLTCCMLAKQLGAQRTVARVDNYEYMKPENKFLFESIGIEMLIYPELLAAKEIADSVRFSWIRQWWDFSNDDLVLISVKMHDEQPKYDKESSNDKNMLVGRTLKDIGMEGYQFHVVAIKRKGETVAPYGDERIMPRDLVFFMTTRDQVDNIRHLVGKDNYPDIHNVMIAGGGKLSVRADWALPDSNMNVKIVEPDMDRCEQLGKLLKNRTLVINGEGHDMELLADEGFENLDAFIALTPNDEENILACVAARRKGVRKTIAQVENLAYLDMAEDLDVGTIINKKTIAASHIYQLLLKADVGNVKMLTVADADVAEFVVKKNSRVTKTPVMNIGLPHGVNIGGVVRNGKGLLVRGNTVLEEGDRAVVFCIGSTLKQLDKYFK